MWGRVLVIRLSLKPDQQSQIFQSSFFIIFGIQYPSETSVGRWEVLAEITLALRGQFAFLLCILSQ